MEKIAKFGAKIGSQRHMIAVRDGFAAIMPLIMAGAFAVLMNNVFFVPWSLLAEFIGADSSFIVWTNENIAPFFGAIDAGAFAIMSLALVFSLAFNLAKSYEEDGLSAGLIAVGAFFILGPLTRVSETAGWVTNYLGAQGIFVALFAGIVATQIFVYVVKKGWTIKMPEMVPPAVGRGFAAIIPGIVTFSFFALIAYLFTNIEALATAATDAPTTIFNWVEVNVSEVLFDILGSEGDTTNFIGALFASGIALVSSIFWTIGLHGVNLLSPILDTVYLPWALENADNYANNAEVVHVWVRSSWDLYVWLGGSGTTLSLIAAIFFASKKQEEREIAKLGVGPGIFMINEPVIFGLPIVLNPIYAIPFIIIPPVLTFISYMAVATGIVGKVVNITPWTTPPIISAYMATLDWKAPILVIINLIIAFLIYLPFVKASNRVEVGE